MKKIILCALLVSLYPCMQSLAMHTIKNNQKNPNQQPVKITEYANRHTAIIAQRKEKQKQSTLRRKQERKQKYYYDYKV